MVCNGEQLHQAQANIRTIWHFLEAARKIHSSLDYRRLAVPSLLQLQERQQEAIEYFSQQTAPLSADSA